MKLIIGFVLIISAFAVQAGSSSECGMEAKPCLEYGAKVFAERCTLCHGTDGLGEGILSLSVKDYPNASLMDKRYFKNTEELKEVITYGGGLEKVSAEMPPWGDELTSTQLESVVMFTDLLVNDLQKAMPMIAKASESLEPSLRIGRATFQGRCSLCHGKYGLGDGKMARIIKKPPPFNLTLSRMPDAYLSDIIHKGGAEMGRSPRMPPFGGDLSENDIESVIMYLKTIRTSD